MRLLTLALTVCLMASAVTIPTAHYDNSRDAVNSQETVLTPANVANLKLLGKYSLDGVLFAQVLYIPAVTIAGVSHNVLIAATMNNSVYALDADLPGSTPLWGANFGATFASPFAGMYVNLGVCATPVVDVANGFVYVVTVNNTPTWTLRKLSLTTGVEAAHVDISGTSQGVAFHPEWHIQHTPLTLANGSVYVGFGAGNEPFFWWGWVFAYDASTLSQIAILNLAPGIGAGVWEPGGGPAVDGSGNLYFPTGNGAWDGVTNFSQSIMKVSPTLAILDWFTPSNESSTSAVDADVASGSVMLIPGTTLLTFGSKDGRVWVIDTTNMGHLQGTGKAPQVFPVASITAGAGTGIYGGCFFGNVGYFPMAGLPTSGFSFSGSTFTTTALASTSANFAQVTMAGSSNAGANPILWMLTVDSSPVVTKRPVTLRARNPVTLAEYWNSGSLIGNYAKFAAPTVANGRVYVPTSDSTVVAFGLVPSTVTSGSVARIGSVATQ